MIPVLIRHMHDVSVLAMTSSNQLGSVNTQNRIFCGSAMSTHHYLRRGLHVDKPEVYSSWGLQATVVAVHYIGETALGWPIHQAPAKRPTSAPRAPCSTTYPTTHLLWHAHICTSYVLTMKTSDTRQLRTEQRIIFRIGTLMPSGLNVDFSPFKSPVSSQLQWRPSAYGAENSAPELTGEQFPYLSPTLSIVGICICTCTYYNA